MRGRPLLYLRGGGPDADTLISPDTDPTILKTADLCAAIAAHTRCQYEEIRSAINEAVKTQGAPDDFLLPE